MMTLYYAKAACSMTVHIVLEELGFEYEAIPVDLSKAPDPVYLKKNPMGAVPVVELDNGQELTEIAMIVQYLADQKPEAKLIAPAGTLERYRQMEWLNFIATEIHKGFSPIWALERMASTEKAQGENRAFAVADLAYKFDVITGKLGDREYLMPSGYSVADAYLFAILNWTNYLKVDMAQWPALQAYMKRVFERPATQKVMKAERLISPKH